MQSLITWEQLLVIVLILLLVYYAAILLLFYRNDFFLARSFRRDSDYKTRNHLSSAPATTSFSEPDTVLYNQVHELMEDCKHVFTAAVNQQIEKALVLDALRRRIQQYPQIRGTSFQSAITNHFSQELEQRLAMVLEDHEADKLWQ